MPKQENITLNKYGKMRLNYLKKHKKADYSIMFLDGTLNTHLKDIQEQATLRVEQIIKQLKDNSDLTEEMKNTDMLYWVGTMNTIKNQAKEIICNELFYSTHKENKFLEKEKNMQQYNLKTKEEKIVK